MVRLPLKAMPGQENPFRRYELREVETLRSPQGISLNLYRLENPRCYGIWVTVPQTDTGRQGGNSQGVRENHP
jgi:hypothetical protein